MDSNIHPHTTEEMYQYKGLSKPPFLVKGYRKSIISNGDVGIIFVTVEDPYSRITRSISKCEYSAIGFYAPSTSTGVFKIIVTLVDLFGVEKPTWLSSGCTLDKLIKNPLVTRLAIRPLKIDGIEDPQKVKSIQSKFRSCICRAVEMVKKPSLEENIFSLFGYYPENKEHRCVTGIDFVNQVITLYGAMDKIQPGTLISLSALDELRKFSQQPDQLSVIGMMGLPFVNGEDNVDISSYIVDTNLFGDLVEIQLPQHDLTIVENEKRKILNLYRPYLTKGFSTFVELLLTHPDFFNTVMKRLKEGQKLVETSEKILYESILNFSTISEEVLSLFSTLQTGNKPDLDYINKLKHKLETEYFTSCLYLNKEAEFTTAQQKKDPVIQELKSWMENILLEIQCNETSNHPVPVDLDQLISIVNNITGSTFDYPNEKKIPAFLLSAGNNGKYHQKLDNGKSIYLDRYNPNLNSLSSNELIEISHHLDTYDSSYDRLREAVTEQLASLYDVSEI